jgi:asparagine synthase (glutamine-hydrolysing)
MSYSEGRFWISYNGEIYNYIELRTELEGRGHVFRTGTDTEVILASYREWGVDCLAKFNGMWAFALLDLDRRLLFCARDRLGVKPFYYHYTKDCFSFGSEIKQLLTLPWVEREINPGAFFDFFVFNGYGCTTEETFYSGIYDLRGGHYLLIPLDRGEGTPSLFPVKWWDIDLTRKLKGLADQEYAERYYELFHDAVRLRLRSDVPVGSCLSGGLDSSGIVCAVDRILHNEKPEAVQKTFTSTSEYPEFDETDYAWEVIRATKVDPAFVEPTPERLLREMKELVWHHDEPFVSTSIFAGWCIFQLAQSQGVPVTLDGQGPDEMMGGYLPIMYSALLADSLCHGRTKDFFGNLLGLRRTHGFAFQDMLANVARLVIRGRLPAAFMPSLWEARKMLHGDFLGEGLRRSMVLNRFRGPNGIDYLDQQSYFATKHGSLPGILRQVDRNSMAFSVEARLPFLDYRLVEYTFSLPSDQLIRNGIPKHVYRNAMKGVLPDRIRTRTSKLGFVTPEREWLKGRAGDDFREVFAGISGAAIYRREYIEKRFAAYLRGSEPFSSLFWKVFNTEYWMNTFIRGPRDIAS